MTTLGLVIFDMDGLMIDSERLILGIWQNYFSRHGYTLTPEQYIVFIGHTDEWCWNYISNAFPGIDSQDLYRVTRATVADCYLNRRTPAKPGLFELLDCLDRHGIPYCIGSSNTREAVLASLYCIGIPPTRFRTIVTGDDVENGKPDPEIFLTCARQCGIPAEQCLVLEDASAGILAASAAGMTSVIIPDLLRPSEEVCALALHQYNSLLDVLPLVEDFAPPRRGCFSRPFFKKRD